MDHMIIARRHFCRDRCRSIRQAEAPRQKLGGEIDDANLPQKYLIDYVRVYERTENRFRVAGGRDSSARAS